jgi:hypothetical protein
MPQLGESVTGGTVDRWLKQEGDLLRCDEPIVEVVTDKVNAEVPSPVEVRLIRINVPSAQSRSARPLTISKSKARPPPRGPLRCRPRSDRAAHVTLAHRQTTRR